MCRECARLALEILGANRIMDKYQAGKKSRPAARAVLEAADPWSSRHCVNAAWTPAWRSESIREGTS